MSVLDIFSERLKVLMAQRNLNIKELSAKTMIPKSTINSWTLKIRVPSIEYLNELADFFSVSADYLLGRSDNQTKENQEREV